MAIKHFKISALSIDIKATTNSEMMSPLSPLVSKRFFHTCITPEQQAGKEIQNILHKRTRPDLLSCAAPLPWRVRAASPDSSDEEEFPGSATHASQQQFQFRGEHQPRHWFANSPTRIPFSPLSDCSFEASPPSTPGYVYSPAVETHRDLHAQADQRSHVAPTSSCVTYTSGIRSKRIGFSRTSADQICGTPPTTIVGTPPCRSGNPLVNDTQFIQLHQRERSPDATTSAIGSELGMLRLSPVLF